MNKRDIKRKKLSLKKSGRYVDVEKIGTFQKGSGCPHERRLRTGNERDDSFLFFWSRHMYEYYCPGCRQMIWLPK